jgi:hypothetical protein
MNDRMCLLVNSCLITSHADMAAILRHRGGTSGVPPPGVCRTFANSCFTAS